MRARGFTALELLITLSITVLVTPILLVTWRHIDDGQVRARAAAEAAAWSRLFSETLRSDLKTRDVDDGASAEHRLVLTGSEACDQVTLLVQSPPGPLVRRPADPACGPERTLAPLVSGLRKDGAVLEVVFAARTSNLGLVEHPVRIGLVEDAARGGPL